MNTHVYCTETQQDTLISWLATKIWFTLSLCLLMLALNACEVRDVTTLAPYSAMIGKKYQIIGDVNAYGIYRDSSDRREIEAITLIPGKGIQGRHVAFAKAIRRGTVITIVSVKRQPAIEFEGAYTVYVVSIDDGQLPVGHRIEVALFRGNESAGIELNPKLYEKIG